MNQRPALHRPHRDGARPRRRRALALGFGLALLGLAAMTPGAVRADVTPDPLTISRAGHAPNEFYGGTPSDTQSVNVGMLADPVNHLLFEYQFGSTCPVVLDADTYRLKARGTGSVCMSFAPVNQFSGGLGVAVAVDPVDHLVLAADNDAGLASLGAGTGEIRVLDEATLHQRAVWPLPPPRNPASSPQHQIAGASWYGPLDELLVLTGNFGSGGVLPGVSVTAYSVPAWLRTGKAAPLWTVAVPQCQATFVPTFANASAYHATGEDALYVPCVLLAPNVAQTLPATNERDGIVKLPMTSSGCPAGATECPDVLNAHVTVAPGVSNDTLFDPGNDRVFMISGIGSFIGSGVVSILVYSGHLQQFLGAAVVGGNADTNQTAVGFDSTTGRFYVVNTGGLSTIDSRRTPVTPGSIFGEFADGVQPEAVFPVVPPDAAHPYTRVIVNDVVHPKDAGTYMPDFTVYADTLPVSADPAADVVDNRTIAGPLPKGVDIQKSIGGAARGYGWHSDLVGGPGDLANGGDDANAAAEQFAGTAVNLPLGKGNRDLLGGSVQQLDLRDGGIDGAAGALQAADDSTAYGVQQCTDEQQLANCLQPPVQPPVGIPTPAQPTGQLMPFPSASCSQPGDPKEASSTVDGAYYTTWSQDATTAGQWDPTQHQVPGTDQTQAHATVACTSPATASAWLRTTAISSADGPGFSIGSASTSSQVSPPVDGGVVTATVTSIASGITVDVGSTGSFSIGEITQAAGATAGGRAGTARATDLVTIAGVSINGAPVCASSCSISQVTDALNQAFPTQLHVEAPAPDDSYMNSCKAQSDGEIDCAGSPGGYKASVEANLVEQLGDHDFNGMKTTEASVLPALRIILYFANDGNPARTREVLDLAGVAATSTMGLSVLPSFVNGTLPTITIAQAFEAATGRAPTYGYVAGSAGGEGGVSLPPQTAYASGPLGVVERTLTGLSWLLRSPLKALQMIGYLAALGVPIVLARRRRLAAR